MKLTEKQALIIEKLGYQSAEGFLRHYPFRYESLFEKPVSQWQPGELVIFSATLVSSFKTFRFNRNQSRTTFEVLYDDTVISITLYNRPFLRQVHYNNGLVVVGTVTGPESVNARSISNKPISEQIGIQPIYATKSGIKQYEIKRLMKKVLKESDISNVLPKHFIDSYQLLNRKEAFEMIHNPSSFEKLDEALRTLKYEEFLTYHLQNALNALELAQGIHKEIDMKYLESKILNLPYALTEGQITSLDEIIRDLDSGRQMNRLLQGDVGSGKTVVALLSAISVVKAGFQVAFMVPTEILVGQHLKSVQNLFPELNVAILTSTGNNRESILRELEVGLVDLVIGTHALFQEDVKFKNLGFVIIDEQHRFGVDQRQSLIMKGNHVDILMLSATPIPRSLASSLYFDLDVSTIQSYPSSRKENITYYIKENSMRSILDDLYKRLEDNDQIYIVCPSISENKKGIRSVDAIYDQCLNLFPDKRVAKIHSQLKPEEKEIIMKDFSTGAIQILVSTTIIEVGIDVHSANTMVIYNAEMFGLATLHQLRGRIGRGNVQGTCYLLSSNESEEAVTRLSALTETSDGFRLSMLDLRTRGMGDLLGDRQSGLPNFILGDIEKDEKILSQAKIDAKSIVEDLNNTEYSTIVNIAKQDKISYN